MSSWWCLCICTSPRQSSILIHSQYSPLTRPPDYSHQETGIFQNHHMKIITTTTMVSSCNSILIHSQYSPLTRPPDYSHQETGIFQNHHMKIITTTTMVSSCNSILIHSQYSPLTRPPDHSHQVTSIFQCIDLFATQTTTNKDWLCSSILWMLTSLEATPDRNYEWSTHWPTDGGEV